MLGWDCGGTNPKARWLHEEVGRIRKNPGGDQAWCVYADQYLWGTRDPRRHDLDDLQDFVLQLRGQGRWDRGLAAGRERGRR